MHLPLVEGILTAVLPLLDTDIEPGLDDRSLFRQWQSRPRGPQVWSSDQGLHAVVGDRRDQFPLRGRDLRAQGLLDLRERVAVQLPGGVLGDCLVQTGLQRTPAFLRGIARSRSTRFRRHR